MGPQLVKFENNSSEDIVHILEETLDEARKGEICNIILLTQEVESKDWNYVINQTFHFAEALGHLHIAINSWLQKHREAG